MTYDEAVRVRRGQYIVHPASTPPWLPMRVTEVALSLLGRPMVRSARNGIAWCPLTEYGLPGEGWVYDRGAARWKDALGRDIPVEMLRALMPDASEAAR